MLLLTVVEPIVVSPYQNLDAIADVAGAQAAQAEEYLARVCAELRSSAGPLVSTRLVDGEAAEHICAVAPLPASAQLRWQATVAPGWRVCC